MQRPYSWPILMVLISILSFAGTTSVTIFSGGLLSIPSAFVLGIFGTSLPMLGLLALDHIGLRRRGLNPPSTILTVIFAIILPSYIMTAGYLLFRPPNSENEEQSN